MRKKIIIIGTPAPRATDHPIPSKWHSLPIY